MATDDQVGEDQQYHAGDATSDHDWDDPDWTLLDDRRGELPEFPVDVFIPAWRDLLLRASHGAGVRPEHVAVPFIGVASAIIGTSRRVYASRSWSEPMTLWTCLVAASGDRKTSGLNVTVRALDLIEKNNSAITSAKRLAHETKVQIAKEALKRWKEGRRAALEANPARQPPLMPSEAIDPGNFIEQRLYVNDPTIERLAELLQARPCGLMFIRDELSGLFANMSRYSGGSDRPFWLEAWNGGRHVVFATSIHANITGRGGGTIVIDDPHDTDDADKAQPLADIIKSFNKNVKSRLNNQRTGRILLVGHRVADGDLTAHLLERGDWDHVVLPVKAPRDQTYKAGAVVWRRHEGDLLRADAWDEKSIADLKETQFNFDWLYMQDCDGQALPSIKARHFPIVASETYANLPCVISVDPGSSDGKHASFSVVHVWAFNRENFYLIDSYRAQCKFRNLKDKIRQLKRRYRPSATLIENTANGPALISELTPIFKNRCEIVPITPRGSKSARLNRHVEKIIQGRVHLARHRDWAEFIEEFVAFPRGKRSDQIDAFTQMADYVQDFSARAKPASRMTEIPMVVAGYSQATGFSSRPMSAADLKKPGICVGRGNSQFAPNGPFIQVKAWVVK